MDDVLVPVFVTVGLLLIAAIFIIGVAFGLDYADCRGFESGTGIKTKWAWSCYAEVDGKWVPKQYAFGEAHEVRVK